METQPTAENRCFRELIDAMPEAVYTTDAEGRLTHFNSSAVEFSGRVPELGSDHWCVSWKLYRTDGTPLPRDECPMAIALRDGRALRGAEAIAERPDGRRIRFAAYPSPLRDDKGKIVGGINMLVDVTERDRSQQLLLEQKRLMELIASGRPLEECLSALCAAVPKLDPGVRAAVLLADDQRLAFQRPIAPDLLPSFGQGLDNAPINDLAIGTCGDAVYYGKSVTCADIATDEQWSKPWRDLCIANGVLACHSTPVPGADGFPLGSFMLCFDEPRAPNEWERQLADFGTRIASIALERDHASEARYRALFEAIPMLCFTVAHNGLILTANRLALTTLGVAAPELLGHDFFELHPEDAQQVRGRLANVVHHPEAVQHWEREFDATTASCAGYARRPAWSSVRTKTACS